MMDSLPVRVQFPNFREYCIQTRSRTEEKPERGAIRNSLDSKKDCTSLSKFKVVDASRLASPHSILHSHHGDRMDTSGTEHALSPLAADASDADEIRTLSATATATATATGSASDDGSAASATGAATDGTDMQTLADEPTTLVATTMTSAAAAAAAVGSGPSIDSVAADAVSTSNLYALAIIWSCEYDLRVPLAFSWHGIHLS